MSGRRSALILGLVVGLWGAWMLPAAQAATYYVATNGSNNNPGTLARPFATLRHAAENVARAGDTILMRGGTYRMDDVFREEVTRTRNHR